MEKEKIAQLPPILEELDIDLWMVIEKESEVLSDPAIDYVVGTGVTWLSFFLFYRDGSAEAIVGNLDIENIERKALFSRVDAYKNSPREFLIGSLDRHQPKRIAINYSIDSPTADGLTYGKYLALMDLLQGTPYAGRLVSAEPIIAKVRGRKSPVEILRIESAIIKTEEIFARVGDMLSPGLTEKGLAALITAERKKIGLPPAWDESHCPSVFTGPQKIGAHSDPTDRTFQQGHIFNIDFGLCYDLYCSDLQRTWYIKRTGETEIPIEVKRGFDTVVNSIEKAFVALKPGMTGIEIDSIARQFILSQGYSEYPHALGHQVGRTAHDGGGLLAPAWERYGRLPYMPIEEGQVYTIEPRIYVDGFGVATIEEIVVITESGARYLSHPQKELYIIESECVN